MDREYFFTQMPAEFKEMRMTVSCNDCQFKSRGPFHVMKVKCQKCFSWNTSEIQGEPDELSQDLIDQNKAKYEALQAQYGPMLAAAQAAAAA